MLFSPVTKILNSSSRLICCIATKSNSMVHPYNTNLILSKQHYFSGLIAAPANNFSKLLDKFKLMNPINKSRYEASSWVLYEKMIDQIPFDEIMKKLDLPDTFNSWFIITELHLWMIFVRLMNEGAKGSMIRNFVMEALWNDVEFRSKKLGHVSSDIRNRQVKELSDQIRGAIIGYDEGLLTNDKVLASMVWRRIFNKECNDPEKIELVVKYIRKQMSSLQYQSFDSLFTDKDVKWIKFE